MVLLTPLNWTRPLFPRPDPCSTYADDNIEKFEKRPLTIPF